MTATSLMNALESELAEQEEERRRAPFRSVDEVRDFIADENPSSEVNITLEMFVVSAEDSARHVRVELIDYNYANHAEEVLRLLGKLDVQRRNKFVFALTLWKPKKRAVDESWEFTVGRVYCFSKVHALRRYYALPQGSAQLKSESQPASILPRTADTLELDELRAAAKEVTVESARHGESPSNEPPSKADSDLNPSPKKRGRAAKSAASKNP